MGVIGGNPETMEAKEAEEEKEEECKAAGAPKESKSESPDGENSLEKRDDKNEGAASALTSTSRKRERVEEGKENRKRGPPRQVSVVRYVEKEDGEERPPYVTGVGVRSVDFPVGAVASHLLCRLCFGYYRDPHTIAECLHTFCKSCLLQHFHSRSRGLMEKTLSEERNPVPSLPTVLPEVAKAPPTPVSSSTRLNSRRSTASSFSGPSATAAYGAGSASPWASSSSCCPLCEVDLGTDPLQSVLHDRTMEEVVNKLFPSLRHDDDQREYAFYQNRNIPVKKEFIEELMAKQHRDQQLTSSPSSKPSSNPLSHTQPLRDHPPNHSNTQSTPPADNNPKSDTPTNLPNNVPADELDFKLLPAQDFVHPFSHSPKPETDNDRILPRLHKPLLRTTGRIKVIQLKKYLLRNLGLQQTYNLDAVEILCNGDRIGDELSLTFVRKTRWLHPSDDLCLHYRLTQDVMF